MRSVWSLGGLGLMVDSDMLLGWTGWSVCH